jgi:predicted kinase
MEKVKEYFSKGFYHDVWEGICRSQHGVVQDDVDGSGDNTLIRVNPYHNEPVYDHVHMVYDKAVKTGNPKVELLASVHDIAKGHLRFYDRDTNRVRFNGHEYGSALFSVNFLREQGIIGDELLSFLKIITLHVISYKENPYMYDLHDEEIELLKALNLCDNEGRICSECRTLDFSKWEPVDIKQSAITDNHFVIMVGIPFSGKSSYTNDFGGKVFSTDMHLEVEAEKRFGIVDNYNEAFRVMSENKINWVGNTVDQALKHFKDTKQATLLDATNLTKGKRSSIATRARKLGAQVKYVMCWRDFSECVQGRSTSEKTIPLSVFKRMLSSFTYPTREEYDSIEHIVI